MLEHLELDSAQPNYKFSNLVHRIFVNHTEV